MYQERTECAKCMSCFAEFKPKCLIKKMLTYGICRFVPASGTTWGGGGGVGWDVNVHVTLRQDVNVHVNLRQQWMLRTRGVGGVGC